MALGDGVSNRDPRSPESRYHRRMRSLLLAAALMLPSAVAAQESIEPHSTITPVSEPPPLGAPSTVALRSPSLSADTIQRWHTGRVLYGVGTAIGLVGSGLTLASVLVVVITDYPCNPYDPKHATNPNDSCNPNSSIFKPPKPTDAAPLLAYIGSSASAVGFIFSASGLGYEHHLLAEMNADPGRNYFAGGTALGLVGFIGIGASYFFGFTDYLNAHDQGVAILTTSITGAALCAVGGLLYSVDSSRMNRAWQRLTTF
jgi:hypothetical protein